MQHVRLYSDIYLPSVYAHQQFLSKYNHKINQMYI